MSIELHKPTTVHFPRTLPTHVATIQDIEDALDGKIKAPVRVVATTNQAGTYASNVLTYGADGALVIDGVTLAVNDRILLTGQITGTQNGIYIVTDTGNASSAAVLTRASDFDTSDKILSGVRINVDAGTLMSDSTWKLATQGTIVLDTTALEFIKVSVSQGTAKHAETIQGDGAETTFEIEHNLGTTDVTVAVRDLANDNIILVGWKPVDGDTIEVEFAIAPDNTKNYRVVVIG